MRPKAKVRKASFPTRPPEANKPPQKKKSAPPEPQLLDRTHSPLLDLPPELRDMIYEFAAANLRSVGITSKGRNLIISNSPLSQVSKQVRNEFSACLVRFNKVASVRSLYAHVHDYDFKRLMRVLKALPADRSRGLYWEASKESPQLSISLSVSSRDINATAAENLGKWAKFVGRANSANDPLFRPLYFECVPWDDMKVTHKCEYCPRYTRKRLRDFIDTLGRVTIPRRAWAKGRVLRSNQDRNFQWKLGDWEGDYVGGRCRCRGGRRRGRLMLKPES